jgi:hypothetical protein
MAEATAEFVGTLVAAILTIMILSYLIGDTPLFKVASHIFVGVTAGYASSIAWHSILWPRLFGAALSGGLASILNIGFIVGWLLVILLFFKVSPRTARVGTFPVALLVGVGAGIVVGGSISGTLIPQTFAAMDTLDLSVVSPRTGETSLERVLGVLVILFGTISTLLYFTFTVRQSTTESTKRSLPVDLVFGIGRFFIAVTFGVMYAGAIMATIVVLAERVQFLRDVMLALLPG